MPDDAMVVVVASSLLCGIDDRLLEFLYTRLAFNRWNRVITNLISPYPEDPYFSIAVMYFEQTGGYSLRDCLQNAVIIVDFALDKERVIPVRMSDPANEVSDQAGAVHENNVSRLELQ